MIVRAVRSRLAADATVSGLVSTRIYALRRPQEDTLPAITLERVSGGSVSTHSGPALLNTPVIRAHLWDTSFTALDTLAVAVRDALHAVGWTSGGVKVTSLRNILELDTVETPADGSEISTFHRIMDFEGMYTEE